VGEKNYIAKKLTMRKILSAIIVLAFLASCKSDAGFNYSQEFVKKERAMIPAIDSTEDAVGRYAALGEMDSVGIVSESLEKKFDVLLDETKAKPAPDAKGGEHFKAEVIKYFEYMKSIYTAYKDFARTDGAERDAARTHMLELVQRKPEILTNIQQAQQQFAADNGFKVEK